MVFILRVNILGNPATTVGGIIDIGAYESLFAPTAATVTISGFVRTVDGDGIGGITIAITDQTGTVREMLTDAQGYYQFENVPTGDTYFVSALRGNYTFTQPTQVIGLIDAATIDFVGENVRAKSSIKIKF